MTERLYYHDSYAAHFRANVIEAGEGGLRVYLDRTAFYPTSGGQPCDAGTLAGAAVLDVIDEETRVAHIVDKPVALGEAECRVDWRRRFDHMQQHTGQHLLSAVCAEMLGCPTLSFHLGAESSTIDIGAPSLDPEQARSVERRVNEIVFEDRAVSVFFAGAAEDLGLRKASAREGELRVVAVEGIDRSACGGTHVRRTGEVGPVLIRKLDKIRGNVRVEFLCGLRAVARARADYDALTQVSRALSAALDDTPATVAAQIERLNDAEKASKKLAAELAKYEGRDLYDATQPGADGLRRVTRRLAQGPIGDELRIVAQSFAARPEAIFTAIATDPPSVLLCVSADAGIHAGNTLKAALSAAGGRGGGNAQLAQGSVPTREALALVEAKLL